MNIKTPLDFEGCHVAIEVEKLPASEQQTKCIVALNEFREKVSKESELLREALVSIANNTCCSSCQEARKVARVALGAYRIHFGPKS